MITFLIIKHQQVSDKWWQSVHCCTMFSLSCGWWRSLQISYDNNRDHLACFMLHACTADILDCPRHAPDDAPGMPQMMPQTCPRWCPQMSPSGRSAVLITEIIWSGNWLDGSGSVSHWDWWQRPRAKWTRPQSQTRPESDTKWATYSLKKGILLSDT